MQTGSEMREKYAFEQVKSLHVCSCKNNKEMVCEHCDLIYPAQSRNR